MLLAALNFPFSDDLHDIERFIARVELEVMSQEFDVLVLPAHLCPSSRTLDRSQAHYESQARTFIDWMCAVSRRKHAFVVGSTIEWSDEFALCRTALTTRSRDGP